MQKKKILWGFLLEIEGRYIDRENVHTQRQITSCGKAHNCDRDKNKQSVARMNLQLDFKSGRDKYFQSADLTQGFKNVYHWGIHTKIYIILVGTWSNITQLKPTYISVPSI